MNSPADQPTSDPGSENVREDIFEGAPDVSNSLESEPAEPESTGSDGGGAVTQSGSGFSEEQTTAGGADAVPDTPDDVSEDNIADADSGEFRREGRDVQSDVPSETKQRSGSDVD